MADFDVVVIGGGPGGYVAAIRAAQLKLKVAVVERENMGGICLNWGCIPTKALLRAAEIKRTIEHAEDFGISVGDVKFDLNKIVARSRGVATQLSGGVRHLMKKNKIEVIDGTAKLLGGGKIDIAGKIISAKNIILATGARARTVPGLEPDGKRVWTYREAMIPTEMPKKLLVIGSGAIGIEFACFYRALGAEVTVVELQNRIMPVEDEEISTLAKKQFEKQGIRFLTGTSVKELKHDTQTITAVFSHDGAGNPPAKGGALPGSTGPNDGAGTTFDRVIVAIGIVGNTENLGLETTKVKVDRNQIVTDDYCRTGEPGVYAIGDVTGGPWLAHKASHEGVIAAEHIAGLHPHKLDRSNIPGCTYAHPQVASVGMTEAVAKAAGREIKVGRFPFIGNGKAIALGEPEGLIKTIFDAKTGELLGAHMIGPEVTELIQGYGIAKTLETTEAELMQTIFAHPTLSEAMHESVLDAYGRAIHF